MSRMTDCVFTVFNRMLGATASDFMSLCFPPKDVFPSRGVWEAGLCLLALLALGRAQLSLRSEGPVLLFGRSWEGHCRLLSFPRSSQHLGPVLTSQNTQICHVCDQAKGRSRRWKKLGQKMRRSMLAPKSDNRHLRNLEQIKKKNFF